MRPTGDRVREATFNALQSLDVVEGAVVADLFAGSGALGIEALSRGAARAVFVESDRRAREVVAANLRATGFEGRAEVVASTAEAFLAGGGATRRIDLALCDPPYRYDRWPDLLDALKRFLAPDAVVVAESDRAVTAPDGWEVAREKAYGGTVVCILYPPAWPDPAGAHT